MNERPVVLARPAADFVASADVSRILRNTYTLLAMTILFSAVTAGIAMAIGM